MATADYIISNQSGASFRTDLNNTLAAIVSNNSNSSEPATKYAYQWWADTSAAVMKIRNSANDGWIELFQLDGTLTLEDGSKTTPALAFRDDLNTGIYSTQADHFNISTGGVERLELGTAHTVFNEEGADVDFRIESNGNANMFFLDAGNNRIAIGTNTPVSTSILEITSQGNTSFSIQTGNDSGDNCTINFGDSADADAGFINYDHGTNKMQFAAGASLAMTIDSNKNVGIGIDSPKNNTGYGGLSINGVNGAILSLFDSDVEQFRLALVANTSSAAQYPPGGAFQIDELTHDGSNLVSGANQKFRFDSEGLKFGTDTAEVNGLSDYEEGEWTPVYNSGVTGSGTYNNTLGHYTKIGNTVFFTLRIQMNSSDANFSHLIINGLPYSSHGSKKEGGVSIGYGQAINQNNTDGKPTGHIPQNASAISFYEPSGGALYANNSTFVNLNETIHARGFYFTAS